MKKIINFIKNNVTFIIDCLCFLIAVMNLILHQQGIAVYNYSNVIDGILIGLFCSCIYRDVRKLLNNTNDLNI